MSFNEAYTVCKETGKPFRRGNDKMIRETDGEVSIMFDKSYTIRGITLDGNWMPEY